jgi:general L-amino acid transport system substrate-binding protein
MRRLAWLTFAAAILGASGAVAQTPGSTLERTKARGSVACGVNNSLPGFAFPAGSGRFTGVNADFCRAIAAAIFDDPEKVTFVPVAIADMFQRLGARDYDVLVRNVTWTSSREVEGQVAFGPVTFYDGQGFMVKKARRVISAKNLGGVSICVVAGSTTELNLRDYLTSNRIEARLVVQPDWAQTVVGYEGNRCDAITTDISGLHALKATFGNADDHIILPQVISKEPLAPVMRQDDNQWHQIIRWVHYAMITAEDLEISRSTLAERLKSTSPEVRRLLGLEGRQGEMLGLSNDFTQRILRHVGNYGESFERNLGRGSPLRFNRGLNALWSQGGLQYAPPFR